MSENNYGQQYQYQVASNEPVAPVSGVSRVKGIISMILGILSIVNANFVFSIAGLILSSMAVKDGETRFSRIGRLTSVIGIIASVVAIIITVLYFILYGVALASTY